MTLAEVLPAVRSLSRPEKAQLADLLARELVGETSEDVPTSGRAYPVYSPHDEFAAASALLELLEMVASCPK